VPAGGFPWSTLAVNLAGCAALGVVLELLARLSAPHRLARPFLGTGLLGGFTTVSAYALETRTLLASGRPGPAAGYLAGASVLRGIEGYGASSRVHTSRLLSLSADLPIAIVIVDRQDRIREFLPQLDELVSEGLVILDPVEVIRYVGREP
jgi:protein CrcB